MKKLNAKGFRPLSIHDNWKTIEETIYHAFCKLDHPTERPTWLWEQFKHNTFALSIEKSYLCLDKLIDNNEKVWFFANDDNKRFFYFILGLLKHTHEVSKNQL